MGLSNTPHPFVIPVFIPHAGCPHRCVFCDQTSTTSQEERLPSFDELNTTIKRFLGYRKDASRFTEISFYGGNFLGLPRDQIRSLLDCAAQYISGGNVQGIRFSTRPDTIDDQRLRLLSEYPVTTIELGVQSMNDIVLTASRRGHSVEDVHCAVSLIKSRPYRLGLQMMVGLPGDTSRGAISTGKQIADLAPDFVRIYPTLVLKGSVLARWYRQNLYVPLGMEPAVALVKSLYAMFVSRGIKVARMGLQATDDLDTGVHMLAGPYHPAFGELVYGALWLDGIRQTLHAMGLRGASLEIRLHPKLVSRVRGHGNHNITALTREFSLGQINLTTDASIPLDLVRLNGRPCHPFGSDAWPFQPDRVCMPSG